MCKMWTQFEDDREKVDQLVQQTGEPIKLAILLSGSGRTLTNLLSRIRQNALNARISCVVSTRSGVKGVQVARDAGLDLTVLRPRDFEGTDEFSEAVYRYIDLADVDLVVCAGFLSMITVPERYRGRIINIHPSLLPLFGGHGYYGDRVHRAVLETGMKVSGCTVHFVDEHYDNGPIILQTCVPVLDNDSVEDLADRVFEAECELYPEAIALYAANRLELDGHRVRVLANH